MGLWALRWPNGDFSIVAAKSKAEAYRLVDEVADPGGAQWIPVPRVAAHFTLTDRAEIELQGFDEDFDDMVDEKVYPILNAAVYETPTAEALTDLPPERVAAIVKKERARPVDTSRTLNVFEAGMMDEMYPFLVTDEQRAEFNAMRGRPIEQPAE